jgi:hypothetical protein
VASIPAKSLGCGSSRAALRSRQGEDHRAPPKEPLRYQRHLGCGPRSVKIGRHVRYWRTDLILWPTDQTNRPRHP